jgi:hypothetical protein
VRRLFAIALGLTIVVPVMAVMLVFAAASSQAQCGSGAPPVGVSSAPGVPSDLVVIYDQAAGRYQLGPTGWAYLAAINEVETDFGHNLSVSSAGAVGWMQIEPGTWAQYAVAADPAKPGAAPDPYDRWDAIFTAARYLHASGAPADWPGAIFAYNHAGWYVAEIQGLAQHYAQTASNLGPASIPVSATPTPRPGQQCPVAAPITPGPVAKLLGDGIAQAPTGAPVVVQEAIAAGDRIIDTAYSTERTPHMLTVVQSAYDCSGSTDFVLANAGLGSPQVDVGDGIAGDSGMLETYGAPGPGRWITVYGSAGHAFIEIAGLVLDTAHYAPTAPAGSGPRWQPASVIPAQLRDGNTWTVRHPPGL